MQAKKRDEEENEIISEMRNKIKNLELEIEYLKNRKNESKESKDKNQEEQKYSNIKKDNKIEENLENMSNIEEKKGELKKNKK